MLQREAPLCPPIVFCLRHGYTVHQTNLRRMSTNSSYSSTNSKAFHLRRNSLQSVTSKLPVRTRQPITNFLLIVTLVCYRFFGLFASVPLVFFCYRTIFCFTQLHLASSPICLQTYGRGQQTIIQTRIKSLNYGHYLPV